MTKQLEQRVSDLERQVSELSGSAVGRQYVNGWDAAALFCGISTPTLRKWVSEGRITPVGHEVIERKGARCISPRFSVRGLRACCEAIHEKSPV